MEEHADASGKIRPNDTDAPEQRKNAMSLIYIFFFQSAGLAALFPVVLLCSGGDMGMLSLLFAAYFHSAACVLSPTTRNRKARLFIRLTYAAAVAMVVEAVLSHAMGRVIMYLDSAWTAAVFGHALADHRASEKAAATAQEARKKLTCELGSIILLALAYSTSALPMVFLAAGYSLESVGILTMVLIILAPITIHVAIGKQGASSSKKAAAAAPSSKEAQEKLAGELGLLVFLALVFSACGMCPLCIMVAHGTLFQTSPLEFVLVILPLLLGSYVPVIIICTLKPSRRQGGGVVVLGLDCPSGDVHVWSYFSIFMLFSFSFLLVSDVTVVLWICVLGLAVLFGYCLGLHTSSACYGIVLWLLVRRKGRVALPSGEVRKK